jgi:hypothetical protein
VSGLATTRREYRATVCHDARPATSRRIPADLGELSREQLDPIYVRVPSIIVSDLIDLLVDLRRDLVDERDAVRRFVEVGDRVVDSVLPVERHSSSPSVGGSTEATVDAGNSTVGEAPGAVSFGAPGATLGGAS